MNYSKLEKQRYLKNYKKNGDVNGLHSVNSTIPCGI